MKIGERELGPNMSKFVTRCIARVSIPDGGGFADGMKFWTDAEHRKKVIHKALELADASIYLMRSATGKTYSDDEEEIAGILMAEIEQAEQQRSGGIP